jgi:asparagine synthase (glutamine-hydrolysing)
MCGIFGSVFSPPIAEGAVREALASIRHRGPDHAGTHTLPGALFGFVRLSILDLSAAAHQPMVSVDGQVMLVFNGEIYNHHALRKELEAQGHTFRTRSDTEVILEGYRAWGEDVVRRIDGMFALAVYDAPRRRLLLGRDRAGKKPLFYTQRDGGIRFASEMKALFAAGTPREVRLGSISTLLALGFAPAPDTLYEGVYELLPGHFCTLEEGGAPRFERYYESPFAKEPLAIRQEDAEVELRNLVRDAVVRRLEADVPLGAFLSGGIDSTIIVGLMAQHLGRKVKTFSIGFTGDDRYDETAYARMAAKAFDTEHTEFKVTPASFDLVRKLVDLHDGPFGDFSAIPTSIVSELTRAHVTVALTGDGGDEVFCGYPRFLAGEAAERIPRPVRAVGRLASRYLPPGPSERSLRARAVRFLSRASLPLAERLVGWSPYFPDPGELIRPELRSRMNLGGPVAFTEEILDRSFGASPLSRVLHHNYASYLPYDLLVKADRSSMLHSLELRSPFLDTALVDFAGRFPDSFRRRGLSTKWILKRAFRDLLPKEIVHRSKMGFTPPLGAWFRGDLRSYVEDHFASGARMHAWFEPAATRALIDAHMQGRADHGARIWLLLTIEVWLRAAAERTVSAAA